MLASSLRILRTLPNHKFEHEQATKFYISSTSE
uniref:Uncharacterized protein n=1 Tax=Nelumbo nucifera TaxID=4432 RepID=A0A822Z487_NELNU|nr:TPA_asm: hypothetical protein HUJ06_014195 [Nelumbo nucifera]